MGDEDLCNEYKNRDIFDESFDLRDDDFEDDWDDDDLYADDEDVDDYNDGEWDEEDN